ncbi:hypothetical protein [Nocardia sp. NPDC050718]|uniref:hypothetical protein n=1 Tax=Nocardia sp. NPDC050718 TaxID=3155788 RepID=UPI0033C957B0
MHHNDAGRTSAESAICSEPFRAELLSLMLDAVRGPAELGFAVRLLHEGTPTDPAEIAATSGVSFALIQMLLGGGEIALPKLDFVRLVCAMGAADAEPWKRAWDQAARYRPAPTVFVPASPLPVGDVVRDSVDESATYAPSESRQFLEQFRCQALTQSSKTFHVALYFTIATAVMMLASAAVTLYDVHSGAPGVATSATVSTISLLLTTFGGVITTRASKARAHLARQAEQVEQSLRADRAFLNAQILLAQVEDPRLRDELNRAAVVVALGQSASATSDASPIVPLTPVRPPARGRRS